MLAMALLMLSGVAVADEVSPDDYPLDFCFMSGEQLDEFGEPVVYEHEGREVRFCCRECLADFKKDPELHLAKLDEAVMAQIETASSDKAGMHERPGHEIYTQQKHGGHEMPEKPAEDEHAGHDR